MMDMRKLATGAVLTISLIGVSSASAANWDPQNTAVTAIQEGVGMVTLGNDFSVRCGAGDISFTAPGAAAAIAMAINPAKFPSCTDPLGLNASVTTFGTWNFVATSTTNVDISITGATVATIHMPGFGCDISMPGPINIPGNAWNNSAHTLTITNTISFPVLPSTETCATVFGTTGRIDASYQLPSSVIIT